MLRANDRYFDIGHVVENEGPVEVDLAVALKPPSDSKPG